MAIQFQDFDSDYLDRLGSGDFRTQQHFVAYFGELIRLKASKRLRSIAAIEDIRQETLTRVLRLLAEQRIRQPERLGPFVNSVCNNVLQEHHRSGSREMSVEAEIVDAIPDPTIPVPDAIARRQMQETVRQILAGLGEKDRCLLKALFLDERSKDDVCRDFGVTRDYLRVLVHRAKQSFKSHYLRATRNTSARMSASGRPYRVLGKTAKLDAPSFAH
ncbi:MAG TPA: sigma-70 family RNA polymerase sigma factor [Candidatus Sulfotelmatobacter sp.]|nr:sigma-70 family RNA polymerase sigma factor [Candidatus Sulfotelmatobacter sp.]